MKTAKTIDLCNNPLTKEPKLERARRILPEWTGLDKQVKQVQDLVSQGYFGENLKKKIKNEKIKEDQKKDGLKNKADEEMKHTDL